MTMLSGCAHKNVLVQTRATNLGRADLICFFAHALRIKFEHCLYMIPSIPMDFLITAPFLPSWSPLGGASELTIYVA